MSYQYNFLVVHRHSKLRSNKLMESADEISARRELRRKFPDHVVISCVSETKIEEDYDPEQLTEEQLEEVSKDLLSNYLNNLAEEDEKHTPIAKDKSGRTWYVTKRGKGKYDTYTVGFDHDKGISQIGRYFRDFDVAKRSAKYHAKKQ